MRQFTQNRFLVLLVAILLTANLALMSYFFIFRNKQGNGEKSNRPVSDFVQKQLGFNADQAAKFQQLRDEHKEAIKPVLDEMKNLKDSLYDLLRNPGTHDSDVAAVADKIGQDEKQWELLIFHHFQKVRALCDSSQLPKFDTLVHHMIMGSLVRKKRPMDK